MDKLRNNYTTPEQSKRLLELGVPAWTADCLLQNESMEASIYSNYTQQIRQPHIDHDSLFDGEKYLPCWSVARLMEIYTICSDFQPAWKYHDGIIDDIIECIACDLLEQDFYFSRLEE